MKTLIRKSKNQSGIAIVLAMCLLLVVTIICSVILAAANTTTKGIAYDRKQQQAYLTVSDAANYISKEISGYTRTDRYTRVKDEPSEPLPPVFSEGCDFQPLMDQLISYYKDRIDSKTGAYIGDDYFKAEFYLYPEADESVNSDLARDINTKYEQQRVKVTIKTNSECDVITTLELEEGNKVSYRMSVYSEGNVALTWYDVFKENGDYDYTYFEKKWSWNEGLIERGYGSRNEN